MIHYCLDAKKLRSGDFHAETDGQTKQTALPIAQACGVITILLSMSVNMRHFPPQTLNAGFINQK